MGKEEEQREGVLYFNWSTGCSAKRGCPIARENSSALTNQSVSWAGRHPANRSILHSERFECTVKPPRCLTVAFWKRLSDTVVAI